MLDYLRQLLLPTPATLHLQYIANILFRRDVNLILLQLSINFFQTFLDRFGLPQSTQIGITCKLDFIKIIESVISLRGFTTYLLLLDCQAR